MVDWQATGTVKLLDLYYDTIISIIRFTTVVSSMLFMLVVIMVTITIRFRL